MRFKPGTFDINNDFETNKDLDCSTYPPRDIPAAVYNIYITNGARDCTMVTCDGTLTDPFPTLQRALIYVRKDFSNKLIKY